MTTKRTDDEILAHMKEVGKDDFFGTEAETLVAFLSYETAKKNKITRATVTKEEWDNARSIDPIKEMRDYLDFAVEKAENHRGLSSMRSISHMRAWAWMAGDDELLKVIDTGDYKNYGAPILKAIARKVGYRWPTRDENERINNMAEGKPCRPKCQEGCNR